MSSFETFSQLHKTETPLLIGNVWDVTSAKTFEKLGFKAVATSSAALAKVYGYEDGEKMPFSDLLRMAERIAQNVTIPFSVDIEAGYSRTVTGIVENIEKLHDLGIAGINFEDSTVTNTRTLQPVSDFQKTLATVHEALLKKNINIFINVRTDTFLLGIPATLTETINRIKAYGQAGASGIFVPCIANRNDIHEVVNATALPVNVLSIPGLPTIPALAQLGVKRVSTGNFLYDWLTDKLESTVHTIQEKKSLDIIFNQA